MCEAVCCYCGKKVKIEDNGYYYCSCGYDSETAEKENMNYEEIAERYF